MQRLDLLIAEARADTDNEDVSETTGIPTSLFIKWANRAQEHIQSKILEVFPKLFQQSVVQAAVAGQEAYSIPQNTFLGTRIEKVEFSVNGSEFLKLGLWGAGDRVTHGGGSTPSGYIRQSAQILLQPRPSGNGYIRYTYQTRLPKLDLRRGVVSAVTLAGNGIMALDLEPTLLLPDDITAVTNQGYACIVDKDGNVLMAGIPISTIDATTGAVTVEPGFAFQDGETLPLGAYLVAGKYASTHSFLPEECESFLTMYMEWKAYKKDSSSDAKDAERELSNIESVLIDAYKQAEPNQSGIPITNPDWT